MEYFQLESSDEEQIGIVGWPRADDGRVIHEDVDGAAPSTVDNAHLEFHMAPKTVADVLNLSKGNLYVSGRAFESLRRLRLCGSFHFVHTKLYALGETHDYTWIYPQTTYDVYDETRSVFRESLGERYDIETVIGAADKMPDLDLFWAKYRRWFASERLKKAFDRQSITGCLFAPIEVVSAGGQPLT